MWLVQGCAREACSCRLGVVGLFLKLARTTTRISWTIRCESAILGLFNTWISMPVGALRARVTRSRLRVLDGAVAFQETMVTAETKIEAAAAASSAATALAAPGSSHLVTIGSAPSEVQAMDEGSDGFAEAKDAASTAAEEAVRASVYLPVSCWPSCCCQAAAAHALSDSLSEFKAFTVPSGTAFTDLT